MGLTHFRFVYILCMNRAAVIHLEFGAYTRHKHVKSQIHYHEFFVSIHCELRKIYIFFLLPVKFYGSQMRKCRNLKPLGSLNIPIGSRVKFPPLPARSAVMS